MEQEQKLGMLSKLASKAKRKLNKTTEEESVPKIKRATYEFKTISLSDREKKLQKKIVQIIENNPDCDDPIGRLIEHDIFDKLSDERKQAYILKLSRDYKNICQKLYN